MAMGFNLTIQELESCFQDMGVDPKDGVITFDLFFEWWTDSMGVASMRKNKSKK